MGVINSFSFGTFNGVSEIPQEVLEAFNEVAINPSKPVEFATEIISAGIQGRLYNMGNFDIDRYEAGIRKNEKLTKEKKKFKNLFLDNSAADDDSVTGGITEAQVASRQVNAMADAYEDLLDNYELVYAIETITSLKEDILIEDNINIIECLRQAVNGVPVAINSLKQLCLDYELLGEQVKLVLASGKDIDELLEFSY